MFKIRPILILAAGLVVGSMALPTRADAAADANLAKINLPPGFEIEVFAEIPLAREMAVVEKMGVVFVGTSGDTVYAVVDRDKDRVVDEVVKIATGLDTPAGVAFKDGYLFVAAADRILRYVVSEVRPGQRYRALVINFDLPKAHPPGRRYAAIGPDGKLYVALGAPCNVCEVSGFEATILRMNLDGSESEVYAQGVRSAGGMDFEPETGQLFFTDNGVDGMGDDSPPDELNHAPWAGFNFGFPWYAGGRVKAPGYEDATPPGDAMMPVVRFGAHTTPLGIHFYRGKMFPKAYRRESAYIAQHGSRDRAEPIGYRILQLHFDDGRPTGVDVFADGWLEGGEPWGRPVDIKELGDGSLLVSDDHAGLIYRITYTGP